MRHTSVRFQQLEVKWVLTLNFLCQLRQQNFAEGHRFSFWTLSLAQINSHGLTLTRSWKEIVLTLELGESECQLSRLSKDSCFVEHVVVFSDPIFTVMNPNL